MKPYKQVQEFHAKFDPIKNQKPTALPFEQASNRAGYKIEELVEYLAVSAANKEEFEQALNQLKRAIDRAAQKVLKKTTLPVANSLIDQADALTDLLYFTYGSFVLMDLNPEPLFEIVHQANMGKLFPDGTAHYDVSTGKVLKPLNWEKDFAPENKIANEIQRQQNSRLLDK